MRIIEIIVAMIVDSCTLLASLRIALVGIRQNPKSLWQRLICHDYWCFTLIITLPSFIGQFARREVSPIPWTAFSKAYQQHGFFDAISALFCVLAIELWILWIPAHAYILTAPEMDKRSRNITRLLNLFIGLLLMTPHNPIYWLIDHYPKGGGNFED